MTSTRSTPRHRHRLRTCVVIGVGAIVALGASGTADATDYMDQGPRGRAGQVYAISNDPAGNALLVFSRDRQGGLTPADTIPTGGTGTGAGLGSQGAVAVSDNGRVVVAVNPGSDQVSLFVAFGDQLRLVDTESSGGDMPISATIHGRDVYVLNGGVGNNVSGFRVGPRGLEPVPDSTQPLSQENAGPAQVSFTPDGRQLVVTEKNTNSIDTFRVRRGAAEPPVVNASTGVTPFGFAFGRNGELLVSNANGGAAGDSSVSSYLVQRDGGLAILDGPDTTFQTAACWLVATGRYAYTANAGSASLTGFVVDRGGRVDILTPDGRTATTGAGPIDLDASDDGRFVYQLNGADDSIGIFEVGRDGQLTNRGFVTGLPATAVGLAAT